MGAVAFEARSGKAMTHQWVVGYVCCLFSILTSLVACDSKRLCDNGACDSIASSNVSPLPSNPDAALPADTRGDAEAGSGTNTTGAGTTPTGDAAGATTDLETIGRDCSMETPCPAPQVCQPEFAVCVACYASDHCSPPRPFCVVRRDPRDNECVGCLGDEDCGDLSCFDGMCDRCDPATARGCEAPLNKCVQDPNGGGSLCVECSEPGDCEDPERPACDLDSGRCVRCLADGTGCSDGERCSLSEAAGDANVLESARCVECSESTTREDCSADRPFCIADRCVECDPSSGSGCDRSARPFCRTGAELAAELSEPAPLLVDGELPFALCVACASDADCPAGNAHCIAGACVDCRQDADCVSPGASACDPESHRCVPCSTTEHCDHIPGASVCHVDLPDSEGSVSARCVECDALDYRACDNAKNACITAPGPSQFTCSSTPVNSLGHCGDCQSDAACSLGQRCVEQTWQTGSTGHYCLYLTGVSDGPISCSDPNVEPFIQPVEAVSVDGVGGVYCTLDTTTCDVFSHFKDVCANDSSCGDPAEGAYCFVSQQDRRCSYPCSGNADCPKPTRTCTNGYCSPL